MSTVEELKKESDKLASLLKDPEPGLMTWWDCIIESVRNLNKILNTLQKEIKTRKKN